MESIHYNHAKASYTDAENEPNVGLGFRGLWFRASIS